MSNWLKSLLYLIVSCASKNSSTSAIWLAAENIQKIHLFLFSKLVWLNDGQGIEDQEERIKNKKYRSLKMVPSDIILKYKNLVKLNKINY